MEVYVRPAVAKAMAGQAGRAALVKYVSAGHGADGSAIRPYQESERRFLGNRT